MCSNAKVSFEYTADYFCVCVFVPMDCSQHKRRSYLNGLNINAEKRDKPFPRMDSLWQVVGCDFMTARMHSARVIYCTTCDSIREEHLTIRCLSTNNPQWDPKNVLGKRRYCLGSVRFPGLARAHWKTTTMKDLNLHQIVAALAA